jgi:nucleolar protein 14
MRRRNKVGGILDRRFGENDPSMAPEDKMLERFTQEKQRRHKTSSTFDLDDDDEPGELTHMGQSLSLNGPTLADDFDEEGLTPSDAEDHPLDAENNHRKRRRESLSEGFKDEADGVDGQPARKKTKQEVMREVIAKSKLYKYERQAAKDEDEDLREELDKEMGDIHALLRGVTRQATPKTSDLAGMNPDRAALIHGTEKLKFEKDYDLRLRLLALDQKSKPTERTKTEEERLAEESRRLRELETKRLRRMQGEPEDEDEEEVDEAEARMSEEANEDQKDDFGLGTGIKPRRYASELDVEDEDDFIIDDDLVASETDFKASEDEFASDGGESTFGSDGTEFLNELLTEEESKRPDFLTGANGPIGEMESQTEKGVNGDLAYTFPCPQSHDEILEVTKGVVVQDLPTVVRRIRAIYDPRLESDNKGKLRNFTVALIDHVSYLANQLQPPPFDILENLIRHIHSLAKTYPIEVANAFRKHLVNHNDIRALTPTSGDLVLLTAINSIFPTSDHFHQVVTPAILSMARYIGQKVPHTVSDYATGLYMISLCLQYQRLSKRYVPEAMGFLLNTICALCPSRPSIIPRTFAYHESKLGRIDDAHNTHTRNLTFLDTRDLELEWQEEIILKFSLLELSIKLVDAAIDTWTGKPAFQEVFHPASTILKHLGSKTCHNKLPNSTQVGANNSTVTYLLLTWI